MFRRNDFWQRALPKLKFLWPIISEELSHSSFETGMLHRNANSAIAELGNVNFLKRKIMPDDRASFLDLESIPY